MRDWRSSEGLADLQATYSLPSASPGISIRLGHDWEVDRLPPELHGHSHALVRRSGLDHIHLAPPIERRPVQVATDDHGRLRGVITVDAIGRALRDPVAGTPG